MNRAVGFVIFALGGAVGSAVTWRYLKGKYERIAQKEIDSVKEIFSAREAYISPSKTEDRQQNSKSSDKNSEIFDQLKERCDYTQYLNKREEKKEDMTEKPYVISPDNFGEMDDYETIGLNYYADGVLTDDDDNVLSNADDIVGPGALYTFGEYEDDSVFVRNDRLRCDYEILRDERNYSDVSRKKPRGVE